MARLIRRRSMERLELYDLDKLLTIESTNYQLPPPLPPPRIPHRRPSMNPTLERYQFLCNMTRSKTDPIYAATPMFTTIPQAAQEKPHRQLLGSYIRLQHVKPLPEEIPKSPEPKTVETIGHQEEEEEDEKENGNQNDDDDDDKNEDNDENISGDSSSSSDDDDKKGKAGGGGDDDDDNNKGIVEQIFNRDKKN